jgi:DNA-binding transcriptional ArsR family regulator
MTPSTPTTTVRIPRSEQDLETRMAKALAHPLRAKVLNRLNEGVASPNEMSRELGEPLGNVSYHVKALLELGCIELVDTAQRRGAIEHYYRAVRTAALVADSTKDAATNASEARVAQRAIKTILEAEDGLDRLLELAEELKGSTERHLVLATA